MTELDRVESTQLSLVMANYKALVKKPLLALPEACRPDALVLWTMHRHLVGMESAMAISAAVSVWIQRNGLSEEDASDAMRALVSPERMGGFKFASDLMTALAAEVTERIRRRRTEREQEERRREMASVKPASADEVRRARELFAGIGQI